SVCFVFLYLMLYFFMFFFFFQAEDGIRDYKVTGVQTCALPIFERAQMNMPTREIPDAEVVWLCSLLALPSCLAPFKSPGSSGPRLTSLLSCRRITLDSSSCRLQRRRASFC